MASLVGATAGAGGVATAALLKAVATDHLPTNWTTGSCPGPRGNIMVNKRSGETLLHVAAHWGSIDVLRHLLSDTRINLEVHDFNGKTALHEAAGQSHGLEVAKALLASGAQVDALKRGDWTPLMVAATSSSLDMIKLLLEVGGADVNLRNKDGWTAFHLASREGHLHVINYFLDKFPDIWKTRSNNQRSPLHSAALRGTRNFPVVLLLSTRPEAMVDSCDSCGSTAFMDAVRSDAVDVCRTLVKQGADFNKLDLLGRSALHIGAECGALKVIEYLVTVLKMDVNKRTQPGQTPLHVAAREGKPETVALLQSLGGDMGLSDINGRVPGQIADIYRREQCSLLLR